MAVAWAAVAVLLLNAVAGYGLAQPPVPTQSLQGPLGEALVICTPSGLRVIAPAPDTGEPPAGDDCVFCPCCLSGSAGAVLAAAPDALPAPPTPFLTLRRAAKRMVPPRRRAWVLPASRAPPSIA